jgi:hypothetical protein
MFYRESRKALDARLQRAGMTEKATVTPAGKCQFNYDILK